MSRKLMVESYLERTFITLDRYALEAEYAVLNLLG
jgi:hypothetical protein